MIKKYILALSLCFTMGIAAHADDHTRFQELSLDMNPQQLLQELERRGMQREGDRHLLWHLSDMDITIRLNCKNDTAGINCLTMETCSTGTRDPKGDYALLMKWMRKGYGVPTWEGTVRSHPFARWYVAPDRDIVMITTGGQTVEVWFYENHQRRNVDYYSILKYCERHPADGVPYLTASEAVTWKSSAPVAKKKPSRHHMRKKASKSRRKARGHKRRRR